MKRVLTTADGTSRHTDSEVILLCLYSIKIAPRSGRIQFYARAPTIFVERFSPDDGILYDVGCDDIIDSEVGVDIIDNDVGVDIMDICREGCEKL